MHTYDMGFLCKDLTKNVSITRVFHISRSSVHDCFDKLFVIDVSLRVLVATEQLFHLFIVELFSEGREEVSEFRGRDVSVSVFVEVSQTLDKVLRGVVVPLLANGRQHGQKDFEGDAVVGPVLVLHHQLLDVALRGVLAQRSHHIADQVDGNLSVASVVVQQESLVKLIDLVLRELNTGPR